MIALTAHYSHPLHGAAEVFWLLVGLATVIFVFFLPTLLILSGNDPDKRRKARYTLRYGPLRGPGKYRRKLRQEQRDAGPPPPPHYRDRD